MNQTLIHRGPDGEDLLLIKEMNLCLGHRRLAILDLTAAGKQPMVSQNKKIAMTFNGEIYNYRPLKKELISEGYQFRSQCDSEVLVNAIERWGIERALKKSVGMFALCAVDLKTREIYLARDRVGEKPLYYYQDSTNFAFASELRAIVKTPIELEINHQALYHQWVLNCIPRRLSIYKNIFKVLPGEIVKIDSNNHLKRQIYWNLPSPLMGQSLNLDELREQLIATLRDQLESDVPMALLLSAGVDSSLLAALLKEKLNRPIKAFTIGFEETQYDESERARELSRYLEIDHDVVITNEQEVLQLASKMGEIYDEPFSDSSQLVTTLVAKKVKEFAKVCLTGDGGDETFMGYNRYIFGPRLYIQLSRIPMWIKKSVGEKNSLIKHFVRLMASNKFSQVDDKMDRLLSLIKSKDSTEFYLRLVGHWSNHPSLKMSPNWCLSFPDGFDITSEHLNAMDFQWYLPDDILVKSDRASMSQSIEFRSPFLDHRLIEMMRVLNDQFKIKNQDGKTPLKTLWEECYRRPYKGSKRGFAVPLARWLRGSLRELMEDSLQSLPYEDFPQIQKDHIESIKMEHLSYKKNHHFALWDLVVFSLWYQNQREILK